MVKPSGIAFKNLENCFEIIKKGGRMTEIEDYEHGQVDVAHKTSKKKTALIMILFQKKSDSKDFYKQKQKFCSLNASYFVHDVAVEREDQGDRECYWRKQETACRNQKTSGGFTLQIPKAHNKWTSSAA